MTRHIFFIVSCYRRLVLAGVVLVSVLALGCTVVVTATPAPTDIPTPIALPTPTESPATTPVPTPTPGPTATPTPTATLVLTPTPEPTATPTPTATPVPTPTPEPTATPMPTATPVPSPTPEPTATSMPIATPTPTPTPHPRSLAGTGDYRMAYCVTLIQDSIRLHKDGYTPVQTLKALMKEYQIASHRIGEVYRVCHWMAFSDEILAVDLEQGIEHWEDEQAWCVEHRLTLLDEGTSKAAEVARGWNLVLLSFLPEFSKADMETKELEVLTGICKRYFRDYPW